MRIPDDDALRPHPGSPTLEGAAVLVDQRLHDGAHREGSLASGIRRVVEDLADRGEPVRVRRRVGEGRQVAIVRIARPSPPRTVLAGDDVREAVVLLERLERGREVTGVVLRLAVGSHDALEAAQRDLALGGDASRCLQRGPAGEHHRRLRRHDQRSAAAGKHRRQRVPIALRADVDAVEDDVHRAARGGELDDPSRDAGGGVEILRAAVHRDARATRDRNPFDGKPVRRREIERGDDAVALGRGERSHVARRIGEDEDAPDALRDFLRRRAEDPEHHAGAVLSERPARDRDGERPRRRGMEIVLLEGRPCAAVAPGQHADDLVGIDESTAPRLDDPPVVLARRLERRRGWRSQGELHVAAGEIADDHLHLVVRRRRRSVAAQP